MKPRLAHRVRRPSPYHTAEASREPGYLARRFAEIRKRNVRALRGKERNA